MDTAMAARCTSNRWASARLARRWAAHCPGRDKERRRASDTAWSVCGTGHWRVTARRNGTPALW